jgi:hypothetical protein
MAMISMDGFHPIMAKIHERIAVPCGLDQDFEMAMHSKNRDFLYVFPHLLFQCNT